MSAYFVGNALSDNVSGTTLRKPRLVRLGWNTSTFKPDHNYETENIDKCCYCYQTSYFFIYAKFCHFDSRSFNFKAAEDDTDINFAAVENFFPPVKPHLQAHFKLPDNTILTNIFQYFYVTVPSIWYYHCSCFCLCY